METEVIEDLREALADGSLSGHALRLYVVDHDEPCAGEGSPIAASCTILREVALSDSVPA